MIKGKCLRHWIQHIVLYTISYSVQKTSLKKVSVVHSSKTLMIMCNIQ